MSATEATEKARCRSLNKDGSRCKHYTGDSSGLCVEHRESADFFNEGFLKCSNCYAQGCDFKGKGTKGYCYYEVVDETTDLDTKFKLIEAMRRTIAIEMRLVNRLERHSNSLKPDDEVYTGMIGLMTKINDSLNHHLNRYGSFLGWQSDTSASSMKEDRIKLLAKALSAEKDTTPIVVEENDAEDGKQITTE